MATTDERVGRAVAALRAWHIGTDVEAAARLLDSYAGRDELSESERQLVLATIAAGERQ